MLGNIWEGTERKEFGVELLRADCAQLPAVTSRAGREGAVEGDGSAGAAPDPKAVAWMTAEQNAPAPAPPAWLRNPWDSQDRAGQNCKLLHALENRHWSQNPIRQREWIF